MSKPHLFMKGGKWVAAINVGPDNLIRVAGDTPIRAHICAVLMAKKAEREESERKEECFRLMIEEDKRTSLFWPVVALAAATAVVALLC